MNGVLLLRHKMWPRYKANRHELQLSSHQEIARILCLVDAMDIPILLVPGVEADDVCATLASRALRVGFSVTVVSPNKVHHMALCHCLWAVNEALTQLQALLCTVT